MDKTTYNTVMISLLKSQIQALTDLVEERLGAEDPKLFAAELRLKVTEYQNQELADLNKEYPEYAALFLDILNDSRGKAH